MDEEAAPNPATLAPLSLAGAARASGVSEVTLRKHLKSGALAASKTETGAHGAAWAIDPATLAAFVGARYGTAIALGELAPKNPPEASPHEGGYTESAAELRRRLDETLVELGRYRALAASAEDTNGRVEGALKERIAELASERDAARAQAEEAGAELARLKARGFWARLFG